MAEVVFCDTAPDKGGHLINVKLGILCVNRVKNVYMN